MEKIRALTRKSLIALIKAYQMTISPIIGHRCRFYPSCSHYTIDALRQYGIIRGLILAIRRICRCHPWGKSGYDPLPETTNKRR